MADRDASPAPTVVYFDGVCNLCNGLVRFIIRRDRRDRFRFVQMQNVQAVPAQRSGDPEFVVVQSRGLLFTESDALVEICRVLGGGWRALSWLRMVPKPFRDGAYRFVAAHRYRWFGRQATCPAPPEHLRHKFVQQ